MGREPVGEPERARWRITENQFENQRIPERIREEQGTVNNRRGIQKETMGYLRRARESQLENQRQSVREP